VVVAAADSVFRLVECRDASFEADFVEKFRMALIRIPYAVFQAPSSHHLDAKIDEICCLQSFSIKFARRRHTPPRSLITKSIVSTKRRDRKAALKFIRKSMKRYGRPEIIVTDKLRSYGAAMKDIGNADRQETGRWLNNRAENSHFPFRRRERAMLRF
jgi:hypothetical protein